MSVSAALQEFVAALENFVGFFPSGQSFPAKSLTGRLNDSISSRRASMAVHRLSRSAETLPKPRHQYKYYFLLGQLAVLFISGKNRSFSP
jgi:hypothetical protein